MKKTKNTYIEVILKNLQENKKNIYIIINFSIYRNCSRSVFYK